MLSHEYAMPAFDLVKSLRTHARDRDIDAWMDCEEAADEIERLREALKQVGLYAWQGDTFKIMDIVRETIIGKEK